MIQDLTQRQGVNLAGVRMIMEMQNELEELRRRAGRLEAELRRVRGGRATPLGPSSAAVGIVPLRTLVSFSWLPQGRRS
jgi:DNA-binding transcriptional MerR regulator